MQKFVSKESILGFAVIAILGMLASFIAALGFFKALSLSSLIIGILLGMVYANTLRGFTPSSWDPGMKFCSKKLLRLGIILYGFRLTFQDVVAVGLPALAVDTVIVCGTLLLGVCVGRLLRLDRQTTLLVSTGSAICGAAAVLGTEPIVKAESHKTAVAVSTVVIFGTLSMFLYPLMMRFGLLSSFGLDQVGIYTGSTLHEVAHVVGAGNAMGEQIATDSLIVKMVRVMFLVPVLFVMSIVLGRNDANGVSSLKSITIPWFAVIFMVMIVVNSIFKYYVGNAGWYAATLRVVEMVSTFMLTLAMTALGADTTLAKFRQAGFRPFALAAVIYVWLVGGGYLLARFLVPLFHAA